jgi:ABC-type glycerol-3-phosphate transport system permease component
MKRLSTAAAQHVLLILLSVVSLYPLWFTAQTALKSPQAYSLNPTGLPSSPTLANFFHLFGNMPFGLWTLNSVIVAVGSVTAATAVSVLAAYAITFGR